mmetsp:Transcript_2309/g.8426  ORF Transcript_2309/g.8426 Transcript_2309/m.8426 type:complete len:127 (-) Transcript_2309:414-794(-)
MMSCFSHLTALLAPAVLTPTRRVMTGLASSALSAAARNAHRAPVGPGARRGFSKQSVRDALGDCCQLSFARSSGPGGQNVNKLNTKVEVRLELAKAAQNGVLDDKAIDRLKASVIFYRNSSRQLSA